MRIIRNEILATRFSFRVLSTEFSARDFGWTRLDVARKFLSDMGVEVSGDIAMQVIPTGDYHIIQITDCPR